LLDTPYWQHCNQETNISRLSPLLEFYEENGPTVFADKLLRARGNQFGVNGFLVMLVGNKIPYRNRHVPTERELRVMAQLRSQCRAAAEQGVCVKEALSYIRHPNWRWMGEV
jgi:tryptophan halogenase